MPIYYTREQKLQLAAERGIIVDPQDTWLIEDYTWTINQDGYAYHSMPRDEDGRKAHVFLHHMIVGYPIWEGEEVDHIDRNPRNNTRSNLRYVNKYVQRQNHGKVFDAKHVDFNKGRWRVRIRRNDTTFVSLHDTQEEAIATRNAWLETNGG